MKGRQSLDFQRVAKNRKAHPRCDRSSNRWAETGCVTDQSVIARILVEESREWGRKVGQIVTPGTTAMVGEGASENTEWTELTSERGFGERTAECRQGVCGAESGSGEEPDKFLGWELCGTRLGEGLADFGEEAFRVEFGG